MKGIMKLSELVKILDKELEAAEYQDGTVNGLQVAGTKQTIRKVALAVDAGVSILKEAAKLKADMLIVHHGLIWGGVKELTGVMGARIRAAIESGFSLYVSHLPLDGHPTLGNAAVIAKKMSLPEQAPFLFEAGKPIGVQGRYIQPKSLSEITQSISSVTGTKSPLVLPFGKKSISKVGIVTGGGSSAVWQAAKEELDLLISGEPKQNVYHDAKDLRINCIFAGHYATETFGVRAVGAWLEKKYKLKTIFIDEPTGI